MSELFPRPPREAADAPEPTSSLEPRLGREEARKRWEVRAAQWRALVLAEAAFDGEVRMHLTGRMPGRAFRGLLRLEVPFRGLGDHRRREAAFLRWVREDEACRRAPFVFVLEPRPVREAP